MKLTPEKIYMYPILTNPYQGQARKVLFVCSAGILRSATAAHIAAAEFGWNTRNVGTKDYALIPVSTELLIWADHIYVMEQDHLEDIRQYFGPIDEAKFTVLNVPDQFEYRHPELIRLLREKLLDEASST